MRIVYIDIDALRADHLGCYGYHRPTTPTIDALAADGVHFQNCYVSDAPCLPSRTALFSGRFGIETGVTCHNGPAHDFRIGGRGHGADMDRPAWMRCLQDAGYRTVSFSGFAQRHIAWHFVDGFTEFYGNQLPGGSESAHQVNEKVLPWLEDNASDEDWFLHVNYWDVHTNYMPPPEDREAVAAYPAPDWPDEAALQENYAKYYGPHSGRDWWVDSRHFGKSSCEGMPDEIRTPEDFKAFVDGYDGALHYVDRRIRELLDMLDDRGVLEDTLIIVSADHGEAIGELGMYFEHGNATEGVHHVPLVIKGPGVKAAGAVDGLIYQLDLPPSILELLHVDIPGGWHGRSFLPALQGGAFRGREYIVRGCGIYSFQRAVLKDDWLLIRTLHPGLHPYEPLYLFDLKEDPHQRRNLVQSAPGKRQELETILRRWQAEYCPRTEHGGDPFASMRGIGPFLYCPVDKFEKWLKHLGRHDQIEDLRQRLAQTIWV